MKLCGCLILYGHVKDRMQSVLQDVLSVKEGANIVIDVVYNYGPVSCDSYIWQTLFFTIKLTMREKVISKF